MKNKLELFSNQQEKWYTISELAELTGFNESTLKYGKTNLNAILKDFGINFDVNTKIVNIGGHKNIKVYSLVVLKALKQYQIEHSAPNALKDKETAISGNVSIIQNKTARQTIESLMDNPDTLQLMLTASIERQQRLLSENRKLKKSNTLLSEEKENLQITLDESKEWYSIKRMEKLNPGQKFSWKLLKNESEKLNISVRKVFDQNYGEVNAYHVSVWESLYFDTLNYGD